MVFSLARQAFFSTATRREVIQQEVRAVRSGTTPADTPRPVLPTRTLALQSPNGDCRSDLWSFVSVVYEITKN